MFLRLPRLQVPKKIGFFLVRQLQDKLQFELYNKHNDEQLFSSLLGEVRHPNATKNFDWPLRFLVFTELLLLCLMDCASFLCGRAPFLTAIALPSVRLCLRKHARPCFRLLHAFAGSGSSVHCKKAGAFSVTIFHLRLPVLLQPSHIVEERRSLMAQLSTLKKAAAVLQRDPQIAGKQNTDICFDVLLLLYFPLLRGAHACLSLSVAPSPWCGKPFSV